VNGGGILAGGAISPPLSTSNPQGCCRTVHVVTTPSLDDQIDMVVRQLATTIDLPPAAIELEVRRAFAAWNQATVRDYVPIFVERQVRTRLMAVG
jgi:hypothetical protein